MDAIRKALLKAREALMTWNSLGIPKGMREACNAQYTQSPEIKAIDEALAILPPEGETRRCRFDARTLCPGWHDCSKSVGECTTEPAPSSEKALRELLEAVTVSEFCGIMCNDVWVDGKRTNWFDRRAKLLASSPAPLELRIDKAIPPTEIHALQNGKEGGRIVNFEPPAPSIECPSCLGRGWETDLEGEQTKCGWCHGSGRVDASAPEAPKEERSCRTCKHDDCYGTCTADKGEDCFKDGYKYWEGERSETT